MLALNGQAWAQAVFCCTGQSEYYLEDCMACRVCEKCPAVDPGVPGHGHTGVSDTPLPGCMDFPLTHAAALGNHAARQHLSFLDGMQSIPVICTLILDSCGGPPPALLQSASRMKPSDTSRSIEAIILLI